MLRDELIINEDAALWDNILPDAQLQLLKSGRGRTAAASSLLHFVFQTPHKDVGAPGAARAPDPAARARRHHGAAPHRPTHH